MQRKKEEEEIAISGGVRKKEKEMIKILGVWIDKEMNWKRHVTEKIGRGKRAANVMLRLGKGGKGMGVENMRTMYLRTVRTIMEYGAQAWWKGQKSFADRMDKANEQAAVRNHVCKEYERDKGPVGGEDRDDETDSEEE